MPPQTPALPQTDYMVGLTNSYSGSPQTMTRLTMALLEDRWAGALLLLPNPAPSPGYGTAPQAAAG
jgi:hypothetical protein